MIVIIIIIMIITITIMIITITIMILIIMIIITITTAISNGYKEQLDPNHQGLLDLILDRLNPTTRSLS